MVLVALVGACTCNCYPPPEVPADEGTADPEQAPSGVDEQAYAAADAAGQACFVLDWLGCPEAHPEGLDCAESLRQLTAIGTFKKANVLCIRTSRTVERVRNCDVECKR